MKPYVLYTALYEVSRKNLTTPKGGSQPVSFAPEGRVGEVIHLSGVIVAQEAVD